MNRLSITVIVAIVFTVVAILLNIYPWQMVGLGSGTQWSNGMAVTDDNILLDIRYAVSKDSRLAVILVHDYTQDKTIWSEFNLDKRLLNYDNAVVTFDLRFHGNSTPVLASGSGTYISGSENGYVDDVKTVIEWTEKNIGKPIVVVGYGEVSRAILQGLSDLKDADIRGVVLIATDYDEVADLISNINTDIMVLSNDPKWAGTSAYFVSISVSSDGSINWNNDNLDLLFNWIKNRAFE